MKKISSLLFVLLLMSASFTADREYPRGDLDLNGEVNIGDVAELIDYLLNGCWSDEPEAPPEEHEYVDLGLPSGTLWATCNIGANSPEEYGDYFSWGGISPQDCYTWSTYTLCEGTNTTLTKYVTVAVNNGYYGPVDNVNELEPEDDAASVQWGPSWRMPSYKQMKELKTECSWQWTQMNGVNGSLVTGPNGNTLFLPASGVYETTSLFIQGTDGEYWSRTLSHKVPDSAYLIHISSSTTEWMTFHRYRGHSVRAVRVSRN